MWGRKEDKGFEYFINGWLVFLWARVIVNINFVLNGVYVFF